MTLPQDSIDGTGDGWAEARAAVEAYIQALQVGSESLTAGLVRDILERAAKRGASESDIAPRLLAMEETIAVMSEWAPAVVDEPPGSQCVPGHGRLALLFSATPAERKNVFPAPRPWPGEAIGAMRTSPLVAEPPADGLVMDAQPLELNIVGNGAASLWESMDRRPIVRKMVVVAVLGLVAAGLWFIFF